MITQEEYKSRRAKLMDSVNDGVIYLKGNDEIQRNPDVPYEFRQNSHFRYLTGINIPGVSMMLIPKDIYCLHQNSQSMTRCGGGQNLLLQNLRNNLVLMRYILLMKLVHMA